jgi:hypothetical protein
MTSVAAAHRGNLASRVTRSIGSGGRSWGQGLVQAAEPGDETAQADHGENPRNAAISGMTSRSPPPSARARLCAPDRADTPRG